MMVTCDVERFGVLACRYGETIRLLDSSCATEPQVWLRVDSPKNKNEMHNPSAPRSTEIALLTLPQARVLRAMLDNAIETLEKEWEV